MNTSDIRRSISVTRAALDVNSIRHASLAIETRLINLPIFLNALRVALYVPTHGEVDILALTTTLDKQFYLPRMTAQRTLEFAHYVPGQSLINNRYGIAEPHDTSPRIDPATLDLVIVPLVAFDPRANRMGRGSGYYDRTFAFLREAGGTPPPHLVGVAYEFQKVAALTPEAWDVPLHHVITETQLYPGDHS